MKSLFDLPKEVALPDPNLALNGLALDALQALALSFTLLAATLFAILLLALLLTRGAPVIPRRQILWALNTRPIIH